MAKITVQYKVPDGNKCTIIVNKEGHMLDDFNHCRFKTSTFIPDENRIKAENATKNGSYLFSKFAIAECMLFKQKLKIDSKDDLPYKCTQCLNGGK